ncbi:MAG: hypothetical protein Q8P50_02855 [Bacillota bacterium]|nr:hypothetical protein [Bacillota bacterium]
MLKPYRSPGAGAKMVESVILYCDILGFSAMVDETARSREGDWLLKRFRAASSAAREFFLESTQAKHELAPCAIQVFSDNTLVGWPVASADVREELTSAIMLAAFYQLTLAEEGFFSRGCIGTGLLYMDDDVVLGPALLEAYRIEREKARDPRIVLSPPAVSMAEGHITGTGQGDAFYGSWLLRDVDGQSFVSYLMPRVLLSKTGETFLTHKAVVEQNLLKFRDDPYIWSKYAWMAGYHNYMCSTYLPRRRKERIGPVARARGPEPFGTRNE